MRKTIFVSLIACLAAPDAGQQDNTPDSSGDRSSSPAETARESAIEELQDQTYEDVMGTDECTEDCSGHNAGWEWAKEHEIFDPDNCGGNSDSFIEGCKAYGEEVERRASESSDTPDY